MKSYSRLHRGITAKTCLKAKRNFFKKKCFFFYKNIYIFSTYFYIDHYRKVSGLLLISFHQSVKIGFNINTRTYIQVYRLQSIYQQISHLIPKLLSNKNSLIYIPHVKAILLNYKILKKKTETRKKKWIRIEYLVWEGYWVKKRKLFIIWEYIDLGKPYPWSKKVKTKQKLAIILGSNSPVSSC